MLKQAFGHIGRLVCEDEAMAVTEYAVMLSLIVIAALGALIGLGDRMVTVFRYEYATISQYIQ